MATKLFIIFSFCFITTCASAQQEDKIRFTAIIQAGLVHGAVDPSWQAQFIPGVKYKTFSLGAGIGLDQYRYKSLPLFIDARKNIFDRPNTPFVYADLGTNYITEEEISSPWVTRDYKKGLYYDLGTGYNWSMKDGSAFIISIGYSQKKVVEEILYHWSPGNETIEYTLRRIIFKAGLRF